MSKPRLSDVIMSPMKVILSPTDLDAGYPYGGTEFGLVRNVQNVPVEFNMTIQNESHNDMEEVLWLGDQEIMGFNLEDWNEDAIPLIFPFGTTATNTGKPVVRKRLSSTIHPGRKFSALSGQRVKMLFVADAPKKDPSFLYYSTIVMRGPSAAARLSASVQWLYPVICLALQDGLSRYSDNGLLEDLQL